VGFGVMADQLFEWTLLFQAFFVARAAELLVAGARAELARVIHGYKSSHFGAGPVHGAERDVRLCMIERALASVADDGFEAMSPIRIADDSGVSIETFFEHFEGAEECFLSGLDLVRSELFGQLAAAGSASLEWELAVPRAIAAMLSYLATHPTHARALFCDGLAVARGAFAREFAFARELSCMLTAGAPEPAGCARPLDFIAGALCHTVRDQALVGKSEMLPALGGYLSFIVLAALLGPNAAADVVTHDARP
jgi:AcrR family transcriptional regulator